jgi:hypothetical protein
VLFRIPVLTSLLLLALFDSTRYASYLSTYQSSILPSTTQSDCPFAALDVGNLKGDMSKDKTIVGRRGIV